MMKMQGLASENLPFKFTSKELDTETGLYCFGARYMDPRLGRFISVDPPLNTGAYFPTGNKDKDKNLPGGGGVFNPVNLNAYKYGADNPLKFIDPDGNSDILYVKNNNKPGVALNSEALAFKDGTFQGSRFKMFQKWASFKEQYLHESVGKKDAEFFLGKADKTFDKVKTVSDDTTVYGTAAAERVYNYRRHNFNGFAAYLLSDPKLGDGIVPQDPQYGAPGKLGIDPATGVNFVEGSHLHRSWGDNGSHGCIIHNGFQEEGGMNQYLENIPDKKGQSGRVLIYR